STTTGLEGANALFRVYANTHANQTNATLGGIKSQNGMQEMAAAESTSDMMNGAYGHVYSDRIIVDNVKNGASGTNGLQEYIQVLYDANTDVAKLSHKTGKGTETAGNIAVFTVKNGTNNKALVDLKPADVLQGFDVIGTTLVTETTDRFGRVVNSSSAAASSVAAAAAVSASSS
ncbi:autotransporter outer membrane beta-barrel domain-containing protein, partial [Campylobacter lari]